MVGNSENKKKQKTIIDGDDLVFLWKVFSKNWYFFLFIPLAAFVVSYFYTYRMTGLYAAKTQILLKNDDTYDYQNQLYKRIGWYGIYGDVTNQKRVLASHDLIRETLDKLDFQVSYYIVGRLRTAEKYWNIPFKVRVGGANPSMYEKPFGLHIISTDSFTLTHQDNDREIVNRYKFGEKAAKGPYIMYIDKHSITEKSLELQRTVEYQFKIHSENNLIRKYKRALKIENVEYTSILELTLTDEIGARAKTFLDTLSAVYINHTLQSQIDINQNTMTYIQRQLEEVTDILDSIENVLESYKKNRAILDLTREENEYFKQLVYYDAEKREKELALKSIKNLETYVKEIAETKQLLPPALYVPDGDMYLSRTVEDLYLKQMERLDRMKEATNVNLGIEQLDKEITTLQKNLLIYIENTRNAYQLKIKELQGQIDEYRKLIVEIPKSQRDILNIERQIQVNEKLYLFLLEKKANTVIAKAGIIPQIKVIETAREIGPAGPNKARISYLFIGAGVAFALFIAFLRYAFFERIENIRELGRMTHVPILGGIMHSEKAKDQYQIATAQPKSILVEAFRGVRTNLQYLNPEVNKKLVLVTSIHPGEGKTFCSSNIAAIIAKAGKKVLLIDFDLHKPKIHKALAMENNAGLTRYLIGKQSQENIILSTGIESLDVLLSGPVPPNASELVLSERVKQLFEWARTNYDMVIIDTPPLGLISDGLALMSHVDVAVFVMNTRHANKHGVRFVEEVIEKSKISSHGILLNSVKQKRWRYYAGRYGYLYGYLYGYKYGYSEEDKPRKKKSLFGKRL